MSTAYVSAFFFRLLDKHLTNSVIPTGETGIVLKCGMDNWINICLFQLKLEEWTCFFSTKSPCVVFRYLTDVYYFSKKKIIDSLKFENNLLLFVRYDVTGRWDWWNEFFLLYIILWPMVMFSSQVFPATFIKFCLYKIVKNVIFFKINFFKLLKLDRRSKSSTLFRVIGLSEKKSMKIGKFRA